MASKDNKRRGRLLRSFGYAFAGISDTVRKEKNIRIHCVISVIVIAMGFYFSISMEEWLFVLLAIAGMLALEMVNTAIERTVDLITGKFHPLAKQAKDIAAGAVLIYAVFSVIIGLIIFLPKLKEIVGL